MNNLSIIFDISHYLFMDLLLVNVDNLINPYLADPLKIKRPIILVAIWQVPCLVIKTEFWQLQIWLQSWPSLYFWHFFWWCKFLLYFVYIYKQCYWRYCCSSWCKICCMGRWRCILIFWYWHNEDYILFYKSIEFFAFL